MEEKRNARGGGGDGSGGKSEILEIWEKNEGLKRFVKKENGRV